MIAIFISIRPSIWHNNAKFQKNGTSKIREIFLAQNYEIRENAKFTLYHFLITVTMSLYMTN